MGRGKKHFTGTIAQIIHSDTNSETLASHVFIDGQQRFTTFTLFILPLMNHFDNENWEEMKNTYLVTYKFYDNCKKTDFNIENYNNQLIRKIHNIFF